MEFQTERMSLQLADRVDSLMEPVPSSLPELNKQNQIFGLILSDPKIARQELAIFPLCLDLARRKARAGGLEQGALFCGLDPKKHPCHPDDPPETPLRLLPSFSLSQLMIDYYRTSLDFQFLLSGGADVIFETARLWRSVQKPGTAYDVSEWPALEPLIQLNLHWISRIWSMLERAGKQQGVAARLSLSEQEVHQLAELLMPLPEKTMFRDKSSQIQEAADILSGLVHTGHNLSSETWHSGVEAGFLAILATQIARLVIDGEELSFSPVLPLGWQGYTLRLTFRGSKFDVQITGSTGKLTLTEGSAIPVIVYGLEYMLEDEFEFDLVKNEAFPDE